MSIGLALDREGWARNRCSVKVIGCVWRSRKDPSSAPFQQCIPRKPYPCVGFFIVDKLRNIWKQTYSSFKVPQNLKILPSNALYKSNLPETLQNWYELVAWTWKFRGASRVVVYPLSGVMWQHWSITEAAEGRHDAKTHCYSISRDVVTSRANRLRILRYNLNYVVKVSPRIQGEACVDMNAAKGCGMLSLEQWTNLALSYDSYVLNVCQVYANLTFKFLLVHKLVPIQSSSGCKRL